ncbi:type VI secretion system Vgr family protein [Burkholderia ubonensis]|uniref:type VI secretion system Vgr family protein n=1 Tax=Burkholderia ubonensis TaxID=101571 RepID=UPI000752A108|nr:type VI secretion system tip protein VgrG [Burkholderia ubonensis]KVU68092.1 type VI secretion protein [Burkholderia ubonensis]KWO88893.1 type VI secretion protein [Burkholderia ubonensis]
MGAQDLIALMNSGLIQSDRVVKLDTPAGPDVLLPQIVVGAARLGRNYEYAVDVVSLRDSLELKSLIAQPVTLWIQQADKSYRPRHGYVHTARRLGADGQLTSMQLIFSSWLHFLKFRKDARIFQDQSVEAILETVFQGHPQAVGAYRIEVRKPSPTRSFCVQYEDDWNFVHRLLEAEGWFYYFEHAEDGKSHTLVITDDLYSLKPLEPERVQFYRAGVTRQPEALVHWAGARTLQSTAYSTRTFDYKNPDARKEMSYPTVANQGDLPQQAEVYEYTGPYSYLEEDRGNQLTKLRLEEWESRAKRFCGVGSLPGIDVGRWFALFDHPEHDRDAVEDRKFAVVEATWYIRNNLPVGNSQPFPHSLDARLAEVRDSHEQSASAFAVKDALGSEGFFLVEVEAQRQKVPFRSPFDHKKPVMHLQTATVVGPENEEVYTDSLNRILVRMHWDRREGLGATCWVRAAYSDTGGGYGSVHVPRVGEEVTIDWVGGDCDRPIATGRVYNGATQPRWHTNGILSGFSSKEYGGGGYNQLVMDDATGQNRLQLFSSQGSSMLHLGYLITQDGNVRGSYLGSGFDLRTDAYGAIRANRGLFLTTFPGTGMAAQQLEVRQAQQQLAGAHNLLESLSDVSAQHQAESLKAGQDALKALTDATTDSIQGQGQASGGRTAGGGTGSANAFKTPILLAASPAGIALSTQQSVHLGADEQLNLVSGQSTHLAAGKSLLASVAERISLFVQNAGMKLFAAKGKVEIQAQSDNIEVTAQKTVKVLSTTDKVEVAASQGVLLTSGGAYIRIQGGNIEIHAPGKIDIKGAQHAFAGPTSAAYDLPALPKGDLRNKLELNLTDDKLKPVPGAPYKVVFDNGTTMTGKLDSNGYAVLRDVPDGTAKAFFGEDTRPFVQKPLPAAKAFEPDDILKELHASGHEGITQENLASLFNQFSGRPDLQ